MEIDSFEDVEDEDNFKKYLDKDENNKYNKGNGQKLFKKMFVSSKWSLKYEFLFFIKL